MRRGAQKVSFVFTARFCGLGDAPQHFLMPPLKCSPLHCPSARTQSGAYAVGAAARSKASTRAEPMCLCIVRCTAVIGGVPGLAAWVVCTHTRICGQDAGVPGDIRSLREKQSVSGVVRGLAAPWCGWCGGSLPCDKSQRNADPTW